MKNMIMAYTSLQWPNFCQLQNRKDFLITPMTILFLLAVNGLDARSTKNQYNKMNFLFYIALKNVFKKQEKKKKPY